MLAAIFLAAGQVIPYHYLPQAGADLVRTRHLPRHPTWLGLGILTAWTSTTLAA